MNYRLKDLSFDGLVTEIWEACDQKTIKTKDDLRTAVAALDIAGVWHDELGDWIIACENFVRKKAKRDEEEIAADKRKIYNNKNELLRSYFSEVSPKDVLRDLFPEGSFQYAHMEGERDGTGNGLVSFGYKNDKGNHCRMNKIVFDNLNTMLVDAKGVDAIFSPNSYWGCKRSDSHIDKIYGFIIDLDEVSDRSIRKNLLNLLNSGEVPTPNYIINSGTGLHFYFLFDKPVEYHDNSYAVKRQLDKLKMGLTYKCWNLKLAYKYPIEVHSMAQGYSVPGSVNRKDKNMIVTSFLARKEKFSLEELNNLVDEIYRADLRFPKATRYSLEQCKTMFPEWYARVIAHNFDEESLTKNLKSKSRKGGAHWRANIKLYEWWLKVCNGLETTSTPGGQARVGNRFWLVACLAIYAAKCDVPFEQVTIDAYSLLDHFNSLDGATRNKFYAKEIDFALQIYNFDFVCKITRKWICDKTGVVIQKTPHKRVKGRPRMTNEQALALARNVRKLKLESMGGFTAAKGDIYDYISRNPDSSINDYLKVGDYGRASAYKYWDICRRELGLEVKPDKRKLLSDYLKSHPEASQRECERELGLSRNFIRGHWKELKV